MPRACRPLRRFTLLALACSNTLFARPAAAQRQSGAQPANAQYVTLRNDGNGVPALQRPVHIDVQEATLADIVRSIQQQAGLGLVFDAELPGLDRRITVRDSGSAAQALLRLLRGSGLEVLVSLQGQAVLVRRAGREEAASINGTVHEAGKNEPVVEADVSLDNPPRRVLTDRAGRFQLTGVPPGTHTLSVHRFGYADRQLTVDAADTMPLIIELQPVPTPLAAVVVSPGTFGVLEESTASRQSLTRTEIETSPQIGEDVFRAITRLPGVAGSDLSAAFGVRGSTNREVLLRLDGVDLVEPFHLKDVDAALSIVDLDAMGGVELMTGGFGAEYGDRLAGVFDMRTSSVPPGPARTTLGVSLTNLRFGSRGAFGGGRGRWLLTARRGYLDLALKLGNATDRIDPVYYDVLGKVEYELGHGWLLSAHGLQANDRLHYHEDGTELDLDSRYGSSYGWLRLDGRPAAGLSASFVASAARLTWNREGHRSNPLARGSLDVADVRSMSLFGLRQDWQLEASNRLLFTWGLDLKSQSADYDYDGQVERRDIVDDQILVRVDTVTAAASPEGAYNGAWLTARLRPVGPLTVELGGRWDRHSWTGDHQLSPRLNGALNLGHATTIRAAWGRYLQAEGIHELQTQDGVTHFDHAEHAEHRVVGIEHSFPFGLEVRAEGYDEVLTHLRPIYTNLISAGDLFPELTDTRVLVAADRGYARGVELMARHRVSLGLEWAVTYALASTKERINGVWTPRPRDQRHTFALDLTWTTRNRWRFGAAWQYHTGWPNTPETLRLDTIGNSIYVSDVWGPYNTDRLPAYHRMDIRVGHVAQTRRGRFLFFIDIFNLYDRENARSISKSVYISRNSPPVYGQNIDSLLPRIPSFGLQWEF